MKFLFVINQLDCGGAEQQMVALCEGLKRRDCEVEVVSIYNRLELKPRLAGLGIPVAVALKYGKFDLTVVWRLRKLIMKSRPDLIHAYLPASSLFTGMTKWTGVRTPIIQSERSVNTWRSKYRVWLDGAVRRRIAAITCNANAIKQHLINSECVPPEKIAVIYNGLAPDRHRHPTVEEIKAARRRILAPPQSFIVIAVANFVKEKEHGILLNAFEKAKRRAHNMFLLLVGRGELEADVRKQIHTLGLTSSTQIIGDCLNPLALLCASHLAILTSSVEGCSNALLEAMAAGLPIVATDAGGNKELVIDGRGGIVCPVNDIEALANGLIRFWENTTDRSVMGRYNIERVKREFTDDLMVERTLGLYNRVLNGRMFTANPPGPGRASTLTLASEANGDISQ